MRGDHPNGSLPSFQCAPGFDRRCHTLLFLRSHALHTVYCVVAVVLLASLSRWLLTRCAPHRHDNQGSRGQPTERLRGQPELECAPVSQTVPSSIEFYYFTLRQIMTGMNDFPGFASVLEPAFNVISDRRGAPVQHLHRAWRWREPKLQRHQPHASARIIHCSNGAKVRRRSTAWIHSGGSAGFLGRMAHPPPLQLDPRESQECRGGGL